jgi:hypothetical protein
MSEMGHSHHILRVPTAFAYPLNQPWKLRARLAVGGSPPVKPRRCLRDATRTIFPGCCRDSSVSIAAGASAIGKVFETSGLSCRLAATPTSAAALGHKCVVWTGGLPFPVLPGKQTVVRRIGTSPFLLRALRI